MRARTVDLAGRLAGLRSEAESTLGEDPWTDPTLAARIADRTNLLLQQYLPHDGAHRERPQDERFDPSVTEAALLVVLPLLHHLHRVRRAAGLAGVRPADLTTSGAATPTRERLDYEAFLYGQDTLVRRADLSRLDDIEHPDGTREIGWWLLHRWIDSGRAPVGRDEIREMLEEAEVPDGPLREALAPDSVERLLSSPRRPPYELAGLEQRPSHLHDYGPWVRPATGQARPVREHLLGSSSPSSRRWPWRSRTCPTSSSSTSESGTRSPSRTSPHPGAGAVAAAGRGRRHRPDRRLRPPGGGGRPARPRGARRRTPARPAAARATSTLLRPLTHLPVYASADAVREVDGQGRRVPASALARFRLDEDRVRSCSWANSSTATARWRSASCTRTRSTPAATARPAPSTCAAARDHETGGWAGRIRFAQGVDEDGRPYLDCDDNGIGMGVARAEPRSSPRPACAWATCRSSSRSRPSGPGSTRRSSSSPTAASASAC